MAVVSAFMPSSSSGDGVSMMAGWSFVSHNVPDTLPTGAAGASIARLLRAALDDPAPIGVTMTFGRDVLASPRVSDLAAMVFARRWPDKYQFHWQATAAQHDVEIDAIRRSTR